MFNVILRVIKNPPSWLIALFAFLALIFGALKENDTVYVSRVGEDVAFWLANLTLVPAILLPTLWGIVTLWQRRKSQLPKPITKRLSEPGILSFVEPYVSRDEHGILTITPPPFGPLVQFANNAERADMAGILNFYGFSWQMWQDTLDKKRERNARFSERNNIAQLLVFNPSRISASDIQAAVPGAPFKPNEWANTFVGLSSVLPLTRNGRSAYFNKNGPSDNDFPAKFIAQNANGSVKKTRQFLLFAFCLDQRFLKSERTIADDRMKYFRLITLASLYHLCCAIEAHAGVGKVVDVWAQNENHAVSKFLLAMGFEVYPHMATSDGSNVLHAKVCLG